MYVLSEEEHAAIHAKAELHAKMMRHETNCSENDFEEYREAFYTLGVERAAKYYDPEAGASVATYVGNAMDGLLVELKERYLTHEARTTSLDAEVEKGGGERLVDTLEDEPHLKGEESLRLLVEVTEGLARDEIDALWALAIADGNKNAAHELYEAAGHTECRRTFYGKIVPALKEKVLCLMKH